METSDEKQHAHELIERLDAGQVLTAVRFLELISMGPVAQSLAVAPADDEPLAEDEKQAVRRSEAWFEKNDGKGTSMEDVLAEFDLSMSDFPPDKRGR